MDSKRSSEGRILIRFLLNLLSTEHLKRYLFGYSAENCHSTVT